jgi:hypothetical protein
LLCHVKHLDLVIEHVLPEVEQVVPEHITTMRNHSRNCCLTVDASLARSHTSESLSTQLACQQGTGRKLLSASSAELTVKDFARATHTSVLPLVVNMGVLKVQSSVQ